MRKISQSAEDARFVRWRFEAMVKLAFDDAIRSSTLRLMTTIFRYYCDFDEYDPDGRPTYSGMPVHAVRRIGREHLGMRPRTIRAAPVKLGNCGYIRRVDDVINCIARIAVPAHPPGS